MDSHTVRNLTVFVPDSPQERGMLLVASCEECCGKVHVTLSWYEVVELIVYLGYGMQRYLGRLNAAREALEDAERLTVRGERLLDSLHVADA